MSLSLRDLLAVRSGGERSRGNRRGFLYPYKSIHNSSGENCVCVPMKIVFVFLWMEIARAARISMGANRSFEIVYVNLERDEKKRAHVERMLKHAKCTFRRFNGVDGEELRTGKRSIEEYTEGARIVPTDQSIRQRINGSNAGRAGCHLSHLIVLRGIDISGTERPVLVLEDDVDLDEQFAEKVEEVMGSPPEKWDMILLGGMFRKKRRKHPGNKHLAGGDYEACLHAYLVNGAESARRVADAIDTEGCPGRPVDLIIEEAFRDDGSFRFYCFSPMIAVQRRDQFESGISLPSSAPFYEKFLEGIFRSEFLRPLERSLSKASSGGRSGAEPSGERVGLLFCLSWLWLC